MLRLSEDEQERDERGRFASGITSGGQKDKLPTVRQNTGITEGRKSPEQILEILAHADDEEIDAHLEDLKKRTEAGQDTALENKTWSKHLAEFGAFLNERKDAWGELKARWDAFDPDQARDEAGRFASSPGGGGVYAKGDVAHLAPKAVNNAHDVKTVMANAKEAHEHQLTALDRGQGLDAAIGAKVVRGDVIFSAHPNTPEGRKDAEKEVARQVASTPKGTPIVNIGPIKTEDRLREKLKDPDVKGDVSKIVDTVRASIAVDSFKELKQVTEGLKARGIELASQPKDRFQRPTAEGYRDVKLNVRYPNGHVGEIQVHLKPILEAKQAGHHDYALVQHIGRTLSEEGRKATPLERAAVQTAQRNQRELYAAAYAKAMGSTQ